MLMHALGTASLTFLCLLMLSPLCLYLAVIQIMDFHSMAPFSAQQEPRPLLPKSLAMPLIQQKATRGCCCEAKEAD